jgi:hypothetical protein
MIAAGRPKLVLSYGFDSCWLKQLGAGFAETVLSCAGQGENCHHFTDLPYPLFGNYFSVSH